MFYSFSLHRMSNSPRLAQLRNHIHRKLQDNKRDAGTVVVGAWISGVTTAYYLLKHTTQNVLLIEKWLIAHGATWHNAGQVAAYFDTPFDELVDTFGLDLTVAAYGDIRKSRTRLEEIIMDTKIDVQYNKFIGYAGCSTYEQLSVHLYRKWLRQQAGFEIDAVFIDEERAVSHDIPPQYDGLYTLVSSQMIADMVDTYPGKFIGALAMHKWALNSALFCEELLSHMLVTYPGRIEVYTHTSVDEINLYSDHVVLSVSSGEKNYLVHAEHIVLCTNGFTNFHILNHAGAEIDRWFHRHVEGLVWYMSWYLDTHHKTPKAMSYFVGQQELQSGNGVPSYFYLTRRPYQYQHEQHMLVCVGGPEIPLPDHTQYDPKWVYMAEAYTDIKTFLKSTYRPFIADSKMLFQRHGLMWFTSTGVRTIGPEKNNERLLYNIWCNGVGILSAILGSRKISRYINWEHQAPSIFDPK